MVPFAVGSYFIICGLYQVDIIYSWLGVTQKLTFREDDFDHSGESGSDNESYDIEKRQRVRSSSLPLSIHILSHHPRVFHLFSYFLGVEVELSKLSTLLLGACYSKEGYGAVYSVSLFFQQYLRWYLVVFQVTGSEKAKYR